jgi:hypothetical protein
VSYGEYINFLDDHLWSVVCVSLACLLLYLIIYRKHVFSIFDPLFFAVFATAMANATAVFLYLEGYISNKYFSSFLFTEIAFLAGFHLIRSVKKDSGHLGNLEPVWYDSTLFITVLFFWSSSLHMFLQLLTYAVVGLPIMMDSRVLTYAGGSGFGLVGRMNEVMGGVGTVLVLYRLFYCNFRGFARAYNYFYLVMILFFLIVSGNKTNIVYLVYYLFLVQLCMKKLSPAIVINKVNKQVSRTQAILFITSIPLIFLVISIQFSNMAGSTDGMDAGAILLFRTLSFGDIFYMALPYDVIERMNDKSASMLLLKDFLGLFRLGDPANFPMDLGLEVADYHSVKESSVSTGPNPRYNYFAMLYFGIWGQIVFCFLLGLITSFIRNGFYRLMPNRMLWCIVYVLLNFNVIYIFQDQAYFVAHSGNILFFLPVLILLASFTYLVLINWHKLLPVVAPDSPSRNSRYAEQ